MTIKPRTPHKVFVIDAARRRYIIRINTRSPNIINWPSARTAAHLAHMAAIMKRLGYTVRIAAPIPANVADVSVEQAADALGVGVNSIYDRISRDTIAYLATPNGSRNHYRIPVSALLGA